MFTVKIKENFFDRALVEAMVDKGRLRALRRQGAYLRSTIRNSLKQAPKAKPAGDGGQLTSVRSEPGKPPLMHSGEIKKLTLYSYDRASDSVVVGPVGFAKGRTLEVLELGGQSKISVVRRKGKRVYKPTNIAPRPFVQPALVKAMPRLENMFSDLLKR